MNARNPTLAASVAVLALAFSLTACTSGGNDRADDEQLAADREVAEAMVQAVLDVHAAEMNERRPARLVMGGWEYVAEANAEWSHRLATALRGLAEEMMEDSPDAPWLLGADVMEESVLLFAVYNTEDRADCCRTVGVSVWLRNGNLEFLPSDGVGYIDFLDPPHEVIASVVAAEEQYMRDRNGEAPP